MVVVTNHAFPLVGWCHADSEGEYVIRAEGCVWYKGKYGYMHLEAQAGRNAAIHELSIVSLDRLPRVRTTFLSH